MDIIEEIPGAIIQHGKASNRIYLMSITNDIPIETLIKELELIAEKNAYTKIFAKVPIGSEEKFLINGYITEAVVKGYALFMAKYLKSKRGILENEESLTDIISIARSKAKSRPPRLNNKYQIIKCTKNKSQEIASVYKRVFKSYPFPIFDPKYIEETMDSHIDYFAIEYANKIVALSSAEKDLAKQGVEMTDFATLPEYSGHNLSCHLLSNMDKELSSKKITTAYTIARAKSVAMNITFAKCGYNFKGTLINNTNIAGNIESMNVWSKTLFHKHNMPKNP